MIATETETTPQNEFDLNRFYDAAISTTGNAPEIALFDPQLAEAFTTDFFMERAQWSQHATLLCIKLPH